MLLMRLELALHMKWLYFIYLAILTHNCEMFFINELIRSWDDSISNLPFHWSHINLVLGSLQGRNWVQELKCSSNWLLNVCLPPGSNLIHFMLKFYLRISIWEKKKHLKKKNYIVFKFIIDIFWSKLDEIYLRTILFSKTKISIELA